MKSPRDIKVRKRSNGLFELRYTKDNKQYSIYSSTILGCRNKYSEIYKKSKLQPKTKSMLFITWFDKYISIYKKNVLKANTLKNVIGIFRLHILPYIAQKTLKQIHSLRHTFATRCIEKGVDMVVVQKWLGHTSISMTIDTYTHIEDDYKKEFANNLDYNFIP